MPVRGRVVFRQTHRVSVFFRVLRVEAIGPSWKPLPGFWNKKVFPSVRKRNMCPI